MSTTTPRSAASGRPARETASAQDKHTLIALLENQPGVLNRVASLFRRRGFNVDSLTVGRTERPEVSRMTVVIEGTRGDAIRAERELGKLIHVIRVDHLIQRPAVSRDLALIKVAINPDTRPEVTHLCEVFRARIIDVAQSSVIVEVTGDEDKIDGFVDLLAPIGIIEMARAGQVAMGRGRNVLEEQRAVWTTPAPPPAVQPPAPRPVGNGVLTYDPTAGVNPAQL